MLINKNDKFSIRKFKNGRSDSVKIGAIGVIVGTAIALSAGANSAEAAMKENSDNTTTISNDKGSVIVDTANIQNPDEGRQFSTDPTENGTNTITKTGKVDYKYVTAEGNTVLEENKNQNSGADKTIETPYDVYGKSGEVFKGTTGGDAESSDLDNAKETGKKETIVKDGKTYHLIGEPKVETTGDGAGVYSDTTLGDVTAKLTPEGLNNAEGKITYDTVKPGGKAWIVEQTGKGTYGKYVQADSGAITSDAKMVEAFKAGEAAAKDFTSANVTADGGIKEGDYVFVLEKNTYVTAKKESFSLTAQIQLSSSDNVADSKDGAGATLNRTYEMVQNFKAAPDTLTGDANKAFVKKYLAYLQEKGREDNLLNFKQYITIGMEAEAGTPAAIIADKGDQVDDKGRPTTDITADIESVSESDSSTLEDTPDFVLKLNTPSPDVEEYSYRDEITPLRAYRLASGTTTITYTYAEEKTREVEKKGSVVVNYQTEDGTELKAPYTDTPETVAEVVTEHYYVNADGQEVVVEDKTVRTPKNVAYNTKENETEKPQKLTDAQGNVYYLNEANTKTAVNDTETTSPAEEGTVVEGVTKVTYIYEKAGSVIVNYKTVDGTALTGTVVGNESKTVASGTKDVDNGKPGTAYNTADNGLKPERIKTAEGKVYQLVPESTEGKETGEVVAGETKVVTYVYKEVKGNVVVKYEDTEGNTLAADEQDETDASLNVKYDTADHKKESITKDGVKYYLTAKELKGDSKPATGDVVEGTTTVTYIYEKAGSVIVNYQTEDGTPLEGTADGANVASGAKDTTDAKAGTDYNTADNGMKPNRITTAEGKVYELVPTATKGEETGKVVAGETKEVTYVYKEVKGNVVVKYEDTEGNVIAENEKDETDASLNVKYDTTDHKKDEITKDGVKYYLTAKALKDGSKETGDVVEGTTEVTYVYEKAGQVVVNYQTEDGTPIVGVDAAGANVASGAKDTVDGRPGSAYDTSDNGMKPNRITTAEGKVYELVPTATKGDETGTVVAGETKEVTYVYKEVTGDVVVHYVDKEGNKIAADKDDLKGASLSEKYDTAVDNKPEKITAEDGTVYYITKAGLKDDSKPETGNVVEGKTDVTYVYEKAGSVIVNYQTEDGTPLTGTADGKDIASGAKDTDNGKPGSEYNTADNGMKPTRITTAEGKVYELVPASTKGDETGTVESGQTKEVTYVYKEVKGNVVVKYEDTEGNTLAEDEKDETDASLNVKYDTADHKKAEITKDGVKYYLTAKEVKDGSKPAAGDVVEGTTTVTYVYEKAGQVVVNYQTEDGTPLVGVDATGANVASGAKDTVDGKPGSDYNTSDNGMKPTRITTAEGKVYELVPTATKGDETGKVVAGETKEVTYVYKEVTGDVVVHYVDTEGNVIAEDKEDTKGASLNAKYDTTDNKPATITTKDGKLYVLVPTSTKGDENGKVTEGTTEVTYVYKDVKEEANKAIDKALSEKESKIKENPELTNEEKEKALEEAKKALKEAKTPEDVEKVTTKGKENVEKTPVTPEEKPKAKEAIDKALEEKVKKIDENKDLTPEQKEKAKEQAKKEAEEAKKAIDKAPSKEEVEKAKESGKKELEKEVPTPEKPTPEDKAKAKEEIDKTLENKVKKIDEDPSLTPEQKEKAKEQAKKIAEEAKKEIDKAPSREEVEKAKENGKKEVENGTPSSDNPTTPSPEDKAKAKKSVEKELEEKIKNIDKDPNLTPEQKEKAKEEAKKEAEKVKKSIEEGKTTEWVDEKGNPIKPVNPGTYPAGSIPNYELVGSITNPETGKVTHIFKPVTKEGKTTVWVDVNGKPLKPTAPGTEEAGKVPSYKLVGTTIDPTTGNVIHVFTPAPVINKVTEWVDTEGKVIRPQEDGSKVPGKVPNYELIGTVTNPETGKVTHIFKPVTKEGKTTVWIDVNGKPLKPTAPGTEEAGSVPNYKLVRTITNPETGDVIHVFTPTPVVNKVTEWVDTEGKVIRPQEDGSKDPGKVPNYELVGTVKDPETGKVTHIFKPVTKKPVTVWVDVNGKPLKPLAEGSNPAGEVPGYELVGTKVDPATGNLLHVFKPKGSATPGENPGTPGANSGTPGTNPETPGQNPGTPGQNPGTPGQNPEKPMDPNAPANPAGERGPVDVVKDEFKRLANTGSETTNSAAAGFGALIAGISLAIRRRQNKNK